MEILNCEYDNHEIKINQSKNLSDIIVKIREAFWDYEEESDKVYSLENMKMYEVFFNEKSKSKNLNKSTQRAEIIKTIFQQFYSDNKNNLNFSKENKKLKIDYPCLISIATVIHRILKSIIGDNKFPELLDKLIEENDFSRILDSEMWEGKSLMQIKNEFNNVKEITFALSGSYDDEFELNYIILFYYFYKVFFSKVDSITLKLDCIKASKKYKSLLNPYDFKEKKIKEIAKNYDGFFISNFLISCIIPLAYYNLDKLKIKASDSFFIENNFIIGKEFEKIKCNEDIMKNNSLIIFKKIMKIKNISKIYFSINCLDRFLFKEMINLIGLHQNLEILNLNLFYNRKFYNQRKTYLNYLRGEEFPETEPNIIQKYGIIMFPYISKLGDEILAVIEEDKIPDLLYPEFKKNLNALKIILNEFIMSFKEFTLDITPYEELCKYENYCVQIILFILAIFSSLENSKNIKTLKLICSNIEYMTISQIQRNLNKLIKPKLIDLSNCGNLENLDINIQGISLLFNLEALPFASLKKLNLIIYKLEDIQKIISMLKNCKDKFKNLSELNISLSFAYDINNIFNELLKIYDNIPPCLQLLKINNENMMDKSDLATIIKKIKNYKNNVKCQLDCDCPKLDEILLNNNEDDLNKKFSSEFPELDLNKCEITGNFLNGTNFNFTETLDEDVIKAIIFSMNKIIKSESKNDNKIQKIFEKIYSFMEKKTIQKIIFIKSNNDN